MLLSSSKVGIAYQEQLEAAVKSIFLGEMNARETVLNPSSQHFFELDILIPDLNLGFEFQDLYHFSTTWYYQSPIDVIKSRDNVKTETAKQNGLTLVSVPCWWDSTHESLAATIQFQRSDLHLQTEGTTPISLNPSEEYFSGCFIPDIGEVMLASFASSMSQFSDAISEQNSWWMGEKYDGVRCVWNARIKRIYTRRALIVSLRVEYRIHLWEVENFLDGEIWCGRGLYLGAHRMIKSGTSSSLFRFVVFDDPSYSQHLRPFEHRYARLLFKVDPNNPIVLVASRALTTDHQHVRKALQGVIENEGEGVILRAPKSIYEQGRSTSLVKLKASQKETEALVIAVSSPNTYTLRLPSGITFELEIRNIHPRVGEVVTVEFESLSRREVPEEARVSRIRKDLTWGTVMQDHYKNPQKNVLNEQSRDVGGTFAAKPHRHWTAKKGKNMRRFFEDFAKRHNFDPLAPENWYSISRMTILEEKAADSILHYFSRNHARALIYLFPEIGLEEKKFTVMPVNYWGNVDNRKEFFNQFARSEGFDPLVPANWYQVSKEALLAVSGARAILQYYDQNMGKALIHLYPDVAFNRAKILPSGTRVDVRTKRIYLNKLARRCGLDPLLAGSWYSIPKDTILSSKGIDAMIYPHSSFVDAVMYVYPNIGIERDKLAAMFHWNDPTTRRRFFIRFARDHWFDPLVSDHWYSVKKEEILKVKGARSMLWHYNSNYVQALVDLFPETAFDEVKFNTAQSSTYIIGMNPLKMYHPQSFVHSVYMADPWWGMEGYTSGMRVIWNNTIQKMNLQTGTEVPIAASVQHLLPDTCIDGEIWYGRGVTRNLREVVHADHPLSWSFARMIVLDDPSLVKTEFEDRYKQLLSIVSSSHPLLVASIRCERTQLEELYKKVIASKAPGLLLRRARSLYEYGSSSSLVQLLDLQTLDALVLDTPATDKFFDLELPNQETIQAPMSPHVTLELKSGDVVTVQFTKLSPQGIPLHPEISKLNNNVTWYEVVHQAKLKSEQTKMRAAMYEFASRHGFDALIPENWYMTRSSAILKELCGVMAYYKNHFLTALSHLFPNSFFNSSALVQELYWKQISEGRTVFSNFARRHHFDPLVHDKWYSVKKDLFFQDQEVAEFIKRSKKDYISALFNSFPEIGLERRCFNLTPRNFWTHSTNKRTLFIEYAASKGFDPFIPENWEQHKRQARVYSHANSILKYYNGKLGSALSNLFPETNWHASIIAKLNTV